MARKRPTLQELGLFEHAVDEIERLSRSEASQLKGEPPPGEERRTPRFVRRVHRTDLAPEATLDLHGCDRRQAADRLHTFLSEQHRRGREIILVIHGKGQHVLAETVSQELDRSRLVAEHVQAPNRRGGSGARMARLRRRR